MFNLIVCDVEVKISLYHIKALNEVENKTWHSLIKKKELKKVVVNHMAATVGTWST